MRATVQFSSCAFSPNSGIAFNWPEGKVHEESDSWFGSISMCVSRSVYPDYVLLPL